MTGTAHASPKRSRLRHLRLGVLAALFAAACGTVANSNPSGDDTEGQASQEAQTTAQTTAEWPTFGLDLGNSRAQMAETTVGPENVENLGKLWELTDVNGVSGTPIVTGGALYIGDWSGHVRALNPHTGEEAWATDVGSQVPGTVAVSESHVFAGTWDGRIVALNRSTGAQEWEASVDDHELTVVYGSPFYVDGLVLVPVASDEWWEQPETYTFRGSLVAYDAATGDEVWRYWTTCGAENAGQDNCGEDQGEGPGVAIFGAPTVDADRGVIYFGTSNYYSPPSEGRSDALIAVDIATGEELWVHQFTEGDWWNLPSVGDPEVGPDADVTTPSLFQVNGVDAVGVGDKAGNYKALNRETGEELWSQDGLTEGSIQGGVMSSAAIADGTIYLASNRAAQGGDLIALDINTGDEVWRADIGGTAVGPVSWANGVVYLGTNSAEILGLDAASGEELWSFPVPRQAAGGISIVDGMAYGGWGWSLTPDSPDGGLIAFSLDGAPPDEHDPGETDGAAIFQQNCAVCHGPEGEGGAGPALQGIGDHHSIEEITEVITNGQGQMPAWEDELTPEEIDAVAEFVASLEGDHEHEHQEPTTTTTDTTVPPTTDTTVPPTTGTTPSTTTTEPGGGGECVTATNSEHRDAGRAEGFLILTAVGSGDSLGLWLSTTSLEETSPGVWAAVDGCESDPQECGFFDWLFGSCNPNGEHDHGEHDHGEECSLTQMLLGQCGTPEAMAEPVS